MLVVRAVLWSPSILLVVFSSVVDGVYLPADMVADVMVPQVRTHTLSDVATFKTRSAGTCPLSGFPGTRKGRYGPLGAFLPQKWALPKLEPIPLAPDNRHWVVTGEPGMGKSSLAYLAIMQDIVDKVGVWLLEPHTLGDQVKTGCEILGVHPCIIDPANGIAPSLDPFDIPPGMNQKQVVELLLMSLRSIWEPKRAWGARTAQIFRHTFNACIELGLTFFDSYLWLQSPQLRDQLIPQLRPSETQMFWEGHLRSMRPSEVEANLNALLDKLDEFFAIDSIRSMFDTKGAEVDFEHIMDSGGVCLVYLRRGELATATELLGAIILAKMHITAIHRVQTGKNNRVNWYLDEAYQFWNTSVVLDTMAEARKFGIGVRIFSQTLEQYPPSDRIKMIELAGSLICFNVKRETARLIAPNMWKFDGQKHKYAQMDFFSGWKPWGKQEFWSIQQEQEKAQNTLMSQLRRECMVYTQNQLYAGEVPEFQFPTLVNGQIHWEYGEHDAIDVTSYIPEEPLNLGGDIRWLPPGEDSDWR